MPPIITGKPNELADQHGYTGTVRFWAHCRSAVISSLLKTERGRVARICSRISPVSGCCFRELARYNLFYYRRLHHYYTLK